MLVLTRKETQTIHIGNDIVIRIVQAGASSVKIGIEAPRNVGIVRGELLETSDTPEPLARENELFGIRETTPARVGAA